MSKKTSGFASKPLKGKMHPRWKGGIIMRMGYPCMRVPEHPFANNGYVFMHRLVVEKRLGRYLEKWETIHHINGNKLDYRDENLQVLSNPDHGKHHQPPKYPELREKEWLSDKAKSMSQHEIANLLGCNPRVVYDFLLIHGLKSSGKTGRPRELDERLSNKEWLSENSVTMSQSEIASLVGCNQSDVSRYQKIHGIKSYHKPGRHPKCI
jgi:predicted transcriptional regulator